MSQILKPSIRIYLNCGQNRPWVAVESFVTELAMTTVGVVSAVARSSLVVTESQSHVAMIIAIATHTA